MAAAERLEFLGTTPIEVTPRHTAEELAELERHFRDMFLPATYVITPEGMRELAAARAELELEAAPAFRGS